MSEMRLQVALAKAGVAARRKAAEIIASNRVKVNGRPVNEKGFRVDIEKDRITLDGKPVIIEEKKYYFLLNKPAGVLSTASDERGRKTVFDCVHPCKARLYTAGRLDKETTGLMILTNDGGLTYRLTHPRFGVEKIYEANVKGEVKDEDLARLKKGVRVEGKLAHALGAAIKKKTRNFTVLILTMCEGRKREVRNMLWAIGKPVLELKRTAYGPLKLGTLSEGEYRALTNEEISALKKCAGI